MVDTVRVTRQGVNVLVSADNPPPNARVTRQGANTLVSADNPPPDACITRQLLNVLESADNTPPFARVTRQVLNVLYQYDDAGIEASIAGAAAVTADARVFFIGRRQLIKADPYYEISLIPHTPTTFTLNGTGFGTNSGTAVFSDDLLENFANEDTITAQDNWSGTSTETDRSDMKRVNNSDSRVYNKPCFTNVTDINRYAEDLTLVDEKNGALVYDLVTPLAELEPLIVTAWVKMATTAADPVLGKWGLLRLSNTDSTEDHEGVLSFVELNDRFTITPMHSGNPAWLSATNLDADEDWPEIANVGAWTRIDYIIIPSTIAGRDGTVQVYRYDNDGVDALEKATFTISYPSSDPWNTDGDIQLLSVSGEEYQYVIFQNFLGEGLGDNSLASNSQDVWLDSIMIQRGSIKRVELCDNVDYESATHCEVQKVTSWSDSQIIIDVKQGSLTAGTGYLHVIDESNNSIYYESITLY